MCLVLVTVDKHNKVMAFIGKWVIKIDRVTQRGKRAIALGQKQDIFKFRFLSLL